MKVPEEFPTDCIRRCPPGVAHTKSSDAPHVVRLSAAWGCGFSTIDDLRSIREQKSVLCGRREGIVVIKASLALLTCEMLAAFEFTLVFARGAKFLRRHEPTRGSFILLALLASSFVLVDLPIFRIARSSLMTFSRNSKQVDSFNISNEF